MRLYITSCGLLQTVSPPPLNCDKIPLSFWLLSKFLQHEMLSCQQGLSHPFPLTLIYSVCNISPISPSLVAVSVPVAPDRAVTVSSDSTLFVLKQKEQMISSQINTSQERQPLTSLGVHAVIHLNKVCVASSLLVETSRSNKRSSDHEQQEKQCRGGMELRKVWVCDPEFLHRADLDCLESRELLVGWDVGQRDGGQQCGGCSIHISFFGRGTGAFWSINPQRDVVFA